MINVDSPNRDSYTPLHGRGDTTQTDDHCGGGYRWLLAPCWHRRGGTLAAQRGHRIELIETLLAEFYGRIANTAGDSFLLEFPSAVEAVRCTIAVQEGIAERNKDVPSEQRIEYRIGINVGDVVADGDDLLGDGVNIAARLENICGPGDIILSDNAYQQVRDRLEIAWQDGGEQDVKNIARPVQVWRWTTDQLSTSAGSEPAQELLPQSDKPSIAVLPFDNLSVDPEQEFFSDGIAEDIITELSHFHQFFVIARNSSFTYKGQAVDMKQVAHDLGVQYVIEGSVRQAGSRVRINTVEPASLGPMAASSTKSRFFHLATVFGLRL